ncbi:hypothetical protein GN244_ATG02976 [Phytophthora infestans]|uniref:Uncharacterized protein n=1 Tax=Phytophthora infestans TaxID=4787 RepID=A0A833W6S6_PHYIN|nr:hypothetical protein GN244_ATG02976 [Phytophthora infestans]
MPFQSIVDKGDQNKFTNIDGIFLLNLSTSANRAESGIVIDIKKAVAQIYGGYMKKFALWEYREKSKGDFFLSINLDFFSVTVFVQTL